MFDCLYSVVFGRTEDIRLILNLNNFKSMHRSYHGQLLQQNSQRKLKTAHTSGSTLVSEINLSRYQRIPKLASEMFTMIFGLLTCTWLVLASEDSFVAIYYR